MKKYVSLVFIMAAFISNADEKALLEEANKHYLAQEYPRASELYEQVLNTGKESAQLYFNLGNSYFKNNNYVKAILNYERAKLLAPQNEDIDFNLKVANQFVVDNIEQLPKPFFSRWWDSLVDQSSSGGWAKISIGSFFLFLFLLGSFLFSRSSLIKKMAFYGALLFFVMMITSFSMAYKQHTYLKNHNTAIILCPRVTVKSAPSSTGTNLFLIHEGLKVEITDSLDHWKEIRLNDGNKGWMVDSCLVRI